MYWLMDTRIDWHANACGRACARERTRTRTGTDTYTTQTHTHTHSGREGEGRREGGRGERESLCKPWTAALEAKPCDGRRTLRYPLPSVRYRRAPLPGTRPPQPPQAPRPPAAPSSKSQQGMQPVPQFNTHFPETPIALLNLNCNFPYRQKFLTLTTTCPGLCRMGLYATTAVPQYNAVGCQRYALIHLQGMGCGAEGRHRGTVGAGHHRAVQVSSCSDLRIQPRE